MGDRNNEEVLKEMQSDFLKYDLRCCIVELYTVEDLPPLYTYISQGVPVFWKTTNQNRNTQLSWVDGVSKWGLSRVRLTRHDPKEMMAGVAQ